MAPVTFVNYLMDDEDSKSSQCLLNSLRSKDELIDLLNCLSWGYKAGKPAGSTLFHMMQDAPKTYELVLSQMNDKAPLYEYLECFTYGYDRSGLHAALICERFEIIDAMNHVFRGSAKEIAIDLYDQFIRSQHNLVLDSQGSTIFHFAVKSQLSEKSIKVALDLLNTVVYTEEEEEEHHVLSPSWTNR